MPNSTAYEVIVRRTTCEYAVVKVSGPRPSGLDPDAVYQTAEALAAQDDTSWSWDTDVDVVAVSIDHPQYGHISDRFA